MATGKTDIWMPLYIGDYLAATTHLSAMESGAYLHLLMHQWKNGKLPASEEALRRIARVDSDAWSNAWAMLKTFFDDASGSPVQMRLEAIREECDARKAKSSVKAHKAAEARWSKDAPSNAHAMPQPCPSSSSSSSQVKDEVHEPLKCDAKSIYEAYPRKIGRGGAMKAIEAAFRRLCHGESPSVTSAEAESFLIQAVTAFARTPAGNSGRFTPHPKTWFGNSRYLDDQGEWFAGSRPGSAEATLGMAESPPPMSEAEIEQVRAAMAAKRGEREAGAR